MAKPKVVIDTNVLITALLSGRGASRQLFRALADEQFDVVLTVPLMLEYESSGERVCLDKGIGSEPLHAVIDYLCEVGDKRQVHYLGRPGGRDATDDMVVEAAVCGQAQAIISYNRRDLTTAASFGIAVMTPREWLKHLGLLKEH